MEYQHHIKIGGGEYFSHGDNLVGKHVDAIIEFIDLYPRFVRAATKEEIQKYCR